MTSLQLLIEAISMIKDPRIDRTKKHRLPDIVFIALYALVCGADGWEDIEIVALERFNEITDLIELDNGIPSHDTFQRLFERLDPVQVQSAMSSFVNSLQTSLEGKVVAIDGKTLRHSFDTAAQKSCLHSITAYVTDNATILQQTFGLKKDSEITEIPKLLEMIDVKGATITIDAIGCQKNIVNAIVNEKKADYVICTKKNQPTLYADVDLFFQSFDAKNKAIPFSVHQTLDKGHGRIESRSCLALDISAHKPPSFAGWAGLNTIARITATCDTNGSQREETRYFISSLACNAKNIASAVRQHWSIENSLHWVLDVVFREDDSRIRKGHGPANFAILRRTALSFIKQNKPTKTSNKRARLLASLNHDCAMRLLTGIEMR